MRAPVGVLSGISLWELHKNSLSISLTYIFEEEGMTMQPGYGGEREREEKRREEKREEINI